MGICMSVSSSDHQIHNAESEHCNENALLFVDNKNCPSDTTLLHIIGSVYSKQGSKGLNQDSALLYQGFGRRNRALCGVFDGHGKNGHVVSEMVRNRLPLLLLSESENLDKSEAMIDAEDFKNWNESIASSFRNMDREIKLQENSDFSCSGTTAVVAIRTEEDLILANLGDSRAVLGTITEQGITAVQLTSDLKPSVPSEAERIRSCKGRVLSLKNEPHIQRVWLPNEDLPGLAMSRSFGDFLLKDYGIIAVPEIISHRITDDDQFIILATDGVWDVMSNDEVAAVVWESDSETAARAVVEAANEAWKRKFPNAKVDDCTVVCLFLHNQQRTVIPVKS